MRTTFLILILLVTVIACKEEEPDPNTVTVNLEFTHTVDEADLELDQMIYTNSVGQSFSIKTLKYFISSIKLYKLDGSIISFDDIHYVDIRDAATLTYTLSEKISTGLYAGISFVHGLTSEENISGRFSEAPESLMEWPEPMGGGYHYMKLEGEYKTKTSESFFNFHSGGLDGKSYEVDVVLTDTDFTVQGTVVNLKINMEIQNWFTNPVDWNFEYYGSAIMANQEAQQNVQKNGVDVYTYEVVN